MSADDERDWVNPNEEPRDDRPSQNNPAKNVLLIMLCVGGVCGLLCCGVFGFVAWRLKSSVVSTRDPAEVTARAQEMATIRIPDRFQPQSAMRFDLGIRLGVVVYQAKGGAESGSLVLIDLPLPVEEAQVRAREEMRNAGAGRPKAPNNKPDPDAGHEADGDPVGNAPTDGTEIRDLEITESVEKEREIRGKTVVVRYETGIDRASKREFRQASVTFPGRDDRSSITLVVQLPKDDWNDEEIEATLDSIQ